MQTETIFRLLFFLSFIFMMTIRIYYQSKILRESSEMKIKEGPFSLIAGSVAALTTISFGAEYLLSPGFFSFAYILPFPTWLRWLGAILLAGGIGLLWSAHHYLGMSFHSLVGVKEEHVLVDTGPYKLIRHPIYLAYFSELSGWRVVSWKPGADSRSGNDVWLFGLDENGERGRHSRRSIWQTLSRLHATNRPAIARYPGIVQAR